MKKTRKWVKRREEKGYFSNIIQELKVEDRFRFKEMFRMDIVDFELILGLIFKFSSPKKIIGGHKPIKKEKNYF